MKKFLAWSSLGLALVVAVGCDWTAGSGVESWNERWNFVDFSGVYRRDGDGYLVSDYTNSGVITEVIGNTSGGRAGASNGDLAARSETFNIGASATADVKTLAHPPVQPGSVIASGGGMQFTDNGSGQLLGQNSLGQPQGSGTINYANGSLTINFGGVTPGSYTVNYVQQSPAVPGVTSFSSSGNLRRIPVVVGSVTISVGSTFVLRDNGQGGLAGSGLTGTIDYRTGAWTIDYGPSTVPPNTNITASYRTHGGLGRGSSGSAVHTFTVMQEGETLRITDNNGAAYTGRLGRIRSTSGGTPESGGVSGLIAVQFEVSGTSAAGMEVRMVGTFQGNIEGADQATALSTFSERQMLGTWIESGGATGDIVGTASPVVITIPTQTITPPTETPTT